jgi:acyl-CoA oxidase
MRRGAPVDHCLTSFDEVRLPREALLEAEHGRMSADGTLHSALGNRRKRFLRAIGRVTMGKLCMSGAAVGASRAALAIAVRYGEHRLVSGPRAGERIPVNAHRSHHGRLLQSIATAYAMTFLHRSMVTRFAHRTDEDRDEVERLIAVAKGWITWQARDITAECRERCGAQGLFSVNALSDFSPYVEGTITAEGDNLVIWLKAAAEMVFGYDSTPASAGSPAEGSLTDPRCVRDLLARAETIWQTRARAGLRQGPAKDPVGRWNAASAAALELVSIHARVQAADAFLTAAETAAPTARKLLERICLLFLLREIGPYTGDLLAAGHMSSAQVRRLPEVLEAVVASLAPHMRTLVDAFDLPAEFLDGIPIANSDRFPLADSTGSCLGRL